MAIFARPTKADKSSDLQPAYLTPAEFARLFIKLPVTTGTGIGDFSFAGRRYLIDIYNSNSQFIVLCCGRQTNKSTLLGNQSLSYATTLLNYMILYVSPTETQTKQFSNDRIKKPIDLSPAVRAYHPSSMTSDVYHKKFTTGSEIRLRYAYHNADRIRGIQTFMLVADEVQDLAGPHLPVIEMTLFTAPKHLRRRRYTGTPKTIDNLLSSYYYESSQNEWLIPCHRHRYTLWNIAGEENLPLLDPSKGLVCKKCKQPIDPMDKMAHWASMNPEAKELDGEGFCVPQLIAPDVNWETMVHDYKKFPRYRWMNECAGRPYDSSARPITQDQIRPWCDAQVSIRKSFDVPKDLRWSMERVGYGTFMGIDHGTGEGSYTYVVIGSYLGDATDKLRIIYFERLTGELTEPVKMIAHLLDLAGRFRVMYIGADYGGGHQTNDALLRELGAEKVYKYQYAGVTKKLEWDPELGRFMLARTEIMKDIFEAIKRGVYVFPRWEEMSEEGGLGTEILSVTSEIRKKDSGQIEEAYYSKPRRLTDDGMHALGYMTLASTLHRPRPDIFLPGIVVDGSNVSPSYDDYGPGPRNDLDGPEYD